MKKRFLILSTLLALVLLVSACQTPAQQAASQPVKVTRGDLTITISGSGTIETPHKLDLTFGVGGRIEKLLVKEGDQVKKGELIAQLETDSLALSLAQAKITYAQTELTVKQYELAVSQAIVAVTQAEIALKTAEIALEQTTRTASLTDVRVAQAEVETTKRNLDDSIITLSKYSPGTPGYNEYEKNVLLAQARYKAAQDTLDAMLAGYSTKEVSVKQQQVTAAQQSLAAAKQSLENAKLTAELSKQSLIAAGLSRDYAQKQLERATLTAPFDGAIASVPVDIGDTVLATTTIAHLIDPVRMELEVQVDEVDITGVKTGQRAIIKVDALSEAAFIGKVSSIGLMPKKESGVTLFDVKIILDNISDSSLRGGMSASADIVITERKGVLLVPSRVIRKNNAGKTVVQVSGGVATNEKEVVAGISDGLQTEIISGLEEGETVLENRTSTQPAK